MARILSVEDSPDLQQLMGAALGAKGYDVHYAFNGQEGFEKVLSLSPDLVLLDLMLPHMNGVEVIKRMKAAKETREIPVIVISAYSDEADMLAKSLVALGAIEYIRKPFEMASLLRRVESLLAAPQRFAESSHEIRKGAFRLDLKYRNLWTGGQIVATLPHRLLALLRLLMESKGEVARAKLLRELWPQESPSPNALEKAVERLRKALGSHGELLKTRPSGYEFVA